MKNPFMAVGIICAALWVSPVAAQSQTGALEVTAQISPTGARPEPVRQFPLCLLTKSYAEIVKEVDANDPELSKDQFIDKLKVSDELKDWMKKREIMDLTQLDFDKLVTVDDIMGVPEFLAAYQRSNSGGVTAGLPTPKFREADKEANPEKYEKLKQEYLTNIRKFMTAHPMTINGMELELSAVNPKLKWDKMVSDHKKRVAQLAPDMAQSKYFAGRLDTDLDGKAVLAGLKPGEYWVSSLGTDAAAGDRHMHWDVRTVISAGQVTHVTLSNVNGSDTSTTTP
jgi:hypothetical protein